MSGIEVTRGRDGSHKVAKNVNNSIGQERFDTVLMSKRYDRIGQEAQN